VTVGARNLRGLRHVALEVHPDLLPGVHPARRKGPSHGAGGTPAGGEDDSRGRPSRTGLPAPLPFEFPIRKNLEKSMSGRVPVCPPTGKPSRPSSCDRAPIARTRRGARPHPGAITWCSRVHLPECAPSRSRPPTAATCSRSPRGPLLPTPLNLRRTTSTGTAPDQRSQTGSRPSRAYPGTAPGTRTGTPPGTGRAVPCRPVRTPTMLLSSLRSVGLPPLRPLRSLRLRARRGRTSGMATGTTGPCPGTRDTGRDRTRDRSRERSRDRSRDRDAR
jgi:hypothetical protein